jgi:hypothetical protein
MNAISLRRHLQVICTPVPLRVSMGGACRGTSGMRRGIYCSVSGTYRDGRRGPIGGWVGSRDGGRSLSGSGRKADGRIRGPIPATRRCRLLALCDRDCTDKHTPTAVIPAIEQQIGASLTLVSGRAPVWFASDESRALARFADLWTQWSSVRKVKEGEITANLFGFLMFRPAPGD